MPLHRSVHLMTRSMQLGMYTDLLLLSSFKCFNSATYTTLSFDNPSDVHVYSIEYFIIFRESLGTSH